MRVPVVLAPGLALALTLALAISCGTERSAAPAAEGAAEAAAAEAVEQAAAARAQQFRAQVAATRAVLDEWKPWYDRLREINGHDYPGDFYLSKMVEGALYEVDAMASMVAPGGLEDPRRPRGPLQALVHLKRQLSRRDIDLLVVPIPVKTAIYPEVVLTPLPGEPAPLLDWQLRQLYAQLEENGVEVLDLLPTLLERRFREAVDAPAEGLGTDREAVYRRHEMHWSPYGAEVAAELIAQRIRQYPWFEQVARDFGRAELEERLEWRNDPGGMFTAMVGRGEIPRDTPREWFLKRHVSIRGERWSHNDATSPIMLSGDSFSDPAYGLADQLLHQLGFRVDLIFTPGGTARFDVLHLRRERLAQKRLLIVELYTAFRNLTSWEPKDVFDDPRPVTEP